MLNIQQVFLMAAYKVALSTSRCEGFSLDNGITIGGGAADAPEASAAEAAWARFGVLLAAAPWGAAGSAFVTRKSGWRNDHPTVSLAVNRRVVATVRPEWERENDEWRLSILWIKVAPHGAAAVRAHREALRAQRAERREAEASLAGERAALEAAFASAPRATLRAFVEWGVVRPALAQACERRGLRLREGQEWGFAVAFDRDGNPRTFGATRAAVRVLRAEEGLPEARYAEMPAVWRAGLADHFA